MKKTIQIIFILISIINGSKAQNIGINSTGAIAHPSALLDVDASPSNNKGFVMPRLTTAQRIAIVSPVDGLQVYDTDLKGFYYFNTTTNKWDCITVAAGSVGYFANTVAPIGYLECNGQSVSTTTYPELFNAIGYLYGGAGSAFNLPDLRGEFIRGWDNSRGVDAARVLGSTQNFSTNLPHPVGLDAWGFSTTGSANNGITHINSSDDYTGGANPSMNLPNPTETRPRNIALMPCIKY